MEELYAWLVAIVAALGVLLGVTMLTRLLASDWLRWLIRTLVLVWLLLPWPVPEAEGYYAPALIVALFEGLFNPRGEPGPALIGLTVATLVTVVLFLLLALRRSRRAGGG